MPSSTLIVIYNAQTRMKPEIRRLPGSKQSAGYPTTMGPPEPAAEPEVEPEVEQAVALATAQAPALKGALLQVAPLAVATLPVELARRPVQAPLAGETRKGRATKAQTVVATAAAKSTAPTRGACSNPSATYPRNSCSLTRLPVLWR